MSFSPLSAGSRLVIDGEPVFVSLVDGSEVWGFTAAGEKVRFVLTRVQDEPVQAPSNERWRFGAVVLDAGALSEGQLREAGELLAHLNEVWFGYRSGDRGRPSPGEPREGFDPEGTTLGERLEAKAEELGCSVWKLYKKRRELERRGLGALVDGRATQSASGPAADERLRAAILAEARELANSSDVNKMQFRARVAAGWRARPASRSSCRRLGRPSTGSWTRSWRRRGCFAGQLRAAAARRAPRARISARWWPSGRASSSRSTPRAWMCSRSTRSRSSGSGLI